MEILNVGLLVHRKKVEKLMWLVAGGNWEHGGHSIRFHLLNVEDDLNWLSNIKFDLIIHKISDFLSDVTKTDGAVLETKLRDLEQYQGTIIRDPLCFTSKLIDRLKMMETLCQSVYSMNNPRIKCPRYEKITMDRLKHIPTDWWPCVLKRIKACSDSLSHVMMYCKEYSDEISDKLAYPEDECLWIEYIPHTPSVLYKVYVLGDKFYLQKRPSLDPSSEDHLLLFDSQKMPKTFGPDFGEKENYNDCNNYSSKYIAIDRDLLKQLVRSISLHSGLSIFGFDFVISSVYDSIYLLDLNYFPSFHNIELFKQDFLEYVIHTTLEK